MVTWSTMEEDKVQADSGQYNVLFCVK